MNLSLKICVVTYRGVLVQVFFQLWNHAMRSLQIDRNVPGAHQHMYVWHAFFALSGRSL